MSKSSLVLVAGLLFLAACSEPGMGPTGPQSADSPRQVAPRDPCATNNPIQPPTGQQALRLAAVTEQCRTTE